VRTDTGLIHSFFHVLGLVARCIGLLDLIHRLTAALSCEPIGEAGPADATSDRLIYLRVSVSCAVVCRLMPASGGCESDT